MRKLVAGFAASLDGYIEGPNGEYDWIVIAKEKNFVDYFKRYDAFLMGRKTYEKVLQSGNNFFPEIRNYVCSNTLQQVDKNYTLLKGDIKEKVTTLKKEAGKDIFVFGGANLLASLLDSKLVDEISVSIIPVLLGKGKPMVDALKKNVPLTLLEIEKYSNGTIQTSYKVN